ncbi:TetR/AcrR family transcriptional regulator [Desulfosarcina ovata]|uniref:HTH tetR-type domain-containing protein n=1 Tax=Desulfosarcina ovata subsp. ovata TaxID=2752305 RepID=A0A5K8A6G2_9BACT|nr:TetR/AcrR family transcriptional regulator [Desulfosarcina ovata]BBO88115.1 hypothetical protein DSCOOX_12950 [Desulfosarcina ovata subsp. ovata]
MNNSKTKKSIIRAARDVIAEKGLRDSTISEIAKKANVVDSIIYHYFKNKEDLLFFMVDQEIKAMNRELNYHFKGIIGPISKLGKMIWFHLSLNDTQTKDLRIMKYLMLESRGYSNFFIHKGYRSLKEYTKILKDILIQGVKENFFHENLNTSIVRDMIFGLLDEESINCLGSKGITKTLPDFDNIMALILNMIIKSEKTSLSPDNKKAVKILLAAQAIFSEKGFFNTTMMEIAKLAKVSEGTIYEYYKSKNDLLFSIPRVYIETQDVFLKNVIDNKEPLIKLKNFIYHYFFFFLTNREFLIVYLRDIKLNRQYLSSDLHLEFMQQFSYLNDILDEGKKKGVFNSNVNNRIFINLFVGTFSHLATRWIIVKKVHAIDMMEELSQVVNLLSLAVKKKNEFSMAQVISTFSRP